MEPLVSICCKTYNHEKYIADAIESFLAQKTDFPIEIIIHDDASTDNTANIVKEYEKRYPGVIKPIYQNENQYSKGVNTSKKYIYPKVCGKFIAFCEGDDYWLDFGKLQKQADFLQNNDSFSMCFHKVKVVNTNKSFTGRYLGPKKKGSAIYSISKLGQGGFVHLSSMMIRAKFFKENLPEWYTKVRKGIGGDFKLAIYMGIVGKVYYFDKVMSAYRTGVENSAMTRMRSSFTNKDYIDYYIKRAGIVKEIDEFYKYKYHEELEQLIAKCEFTIALHEGKEGLKRLNSPLVRKAYKKLHTRMKITFFLEHYMPKTYKNLKNIYNYFKNIRTLVKSR